MKYEEFKNIQYKVYTKQEAKELGIEYNPYWRYAETGENVLTDDGFIVPVLRTGQNKYISVDKMPTYIVTPYGTFGCRSGTRCTTEHRADKYTMSGKSYSKSMRKQRKNLTVKEKSWMIKVLNGESKDKAYKDIFKCADKHAYAYANKLWQSERMQMALNKAVQDALDKHGVTYDYILEKLKSAIEEATHDGQKDWNVFMRAMENLIKISDISDKSREEYKSERFLGFRDDELGKIEAEHEVLELSE